MPIKRNPVLPLLTEIVERHEEIANAAALVARGANERAATARVAYKSEPSEERAITMLKASADASVTHQAWMDATEKVTEAMQVHKYVTAALEVKAGKHTIQ